jgi:hypothetical protein
VPLETLVLDCPPLPLALPPPPPLPRPDARDWFAAGVPPLRSLRVDASMVDFFDAVKGSSPIYSCGQVAWDSDAKVQ